jgi:hypothetical protein
MGSWVPLDRKQLTNQQPTSSAKQAKHRPEPLKRRGRKCVCVCVCLWHGILDLLQSHQQKLVTFSRCLHTWWEELCAEGLVVTSSRCLWLIRTLCKKGLLGKKT